MTLPTDRIKKPFQFPLQFPDLGIIFRDMFPPEFPRVDVTDKSNSICIKAELPGMVKDDITVEVNDLILEISGERKDESIEEGETYYRKEMRGGSFSRAFQLPSNVDPEKIEASFKDGILTIVAPKIEEEEVKPLNVKVK